MSKRISRREMMTRALGAAGVLAGGLPAVLTTKGAPAVAPLPDRSDDAPSAPVSIQRCESYEPKLVRRQLDTALDQIGGIGNLVRGKTVTVKLNCTGEVRQLFGRPAYETYHVHPHAVGALCGALHDAGAKRIVLVEAWYYNEPPEEVLTTAGWDLAAIRSAGGQVTIENTRNKGSWPSYGRIKVPWGGYIFPAFDVNQWYINTDVFVSLGKMKNHETAGVTMTAKNLFGVTPTALYADDAPNEKTLKARGAIIHMGSRKVPDGVPGENDHNVPADPKNRVPRYTADIVGARPVDLAIIDGILTIRGGEGWWNKGVEITEPKLLFAGRNPVCTDAVCAAVMGYDPQAPHSQPPFPGDNHLRLLAAVGVGTNNVKRIEVRGLSVEKALHPFQAKAESRAAQRALGLRDEKVCGLPYGGCPRLVSI